MNHETNGLSFLDHIEELRGRLIKAILAMVLMACFFYSFVDKVLAFLIKPVGHVVFTAPADAFIARMTLTLWGGFFLALPVILYQLWQFLATGLKESEIKYVRILGPISLLLFL